MLHGESRFGGGSCAKFGGGFQGRFHDHFQREGERLLAKEIEGPELHRLDDRLGGAEGADDDDHRVRRLAPDLCQQIQAPRLSGLHLGNHEIGLLQTKDLEGIGRAGLRDHPDTGSLELLARPVEKIGFAVNDQNGLRGRCR